MSGIMSGSSEFAATKIDEVRISDREETCTFVFKDPAGKELRLQIHRALALRMVSTLQSQFVALETRAILKGLAPAASEGRAAQESLRMGIKIEARAATVLPPPQVRLCVQPEHRDELNYGLDPDQAEHLARELDQAAKEVRRVSRS